MTTCGCEIGRCRDAPTPREVEDREIRKLCGMGDVGQTLDGVRRLLARVEKAEAEITRLTTPPIPTHGRYSPEGFRAMWAKRIAENGDRAVQQCLDSIEHDKRNHDTWVRNINETLKALDVKLNEALARAEKAERGRDEALARAEKAEEELRALRLEHQTVLRTVRVERFKL